MNSMAKPENLVEICKCGYEQPAAKFAGMAPCRCSVFPIVVQREIVDQAWRGDLNAIRTMIAAGVPFSLECWQCDAGNAPDTLEEAISQGWRNIQRDDNDSWNFLGTCPSCED